MNTTHPYNPNFDDPYFTPGQGFAEAGHVFIHGSQLLNRLGPVITIGETGFGTGMNLWALLVHLAGLVRGDVTGPAESARSGALLNFYSVEAYPLEPQRLMELLCPYWDSGELAALDRSAVQGWYRDLKLGLGRLGWHGVDFNAAGWRVRLRVWFGDVTQMLSSLKQEGIVCTGWFLDGHSPQKNPQMWSRHVMQEVADCTEPGGFAATYTAAGFVKQGLREAGFRVQRKKGFAGKFHMLYGEKPGDQEL